MNNLIKLIKNDKKIRTQNLDLEQKNKMMIKHQPQIELD